MKIYAHFLFHFSKKVKILTSQSRIVKCRKQEEEITTEGEAITSDDTSLYDGILLPRKRLNRKPQLGTKPRPRLDKEEAQQSGADIERGNDPHREIELVRNDAEESPQHGADHQASYRDLLFPFWNPLEFNFPGLLRLENQRLRYFHGCIRSFRPHFSWIVLVFWIGDPIVGVVWFGLVWLLSEDVGNGNCRGRWK